jgi:hypothetical protein
MPFVGTILCNYTNIVVVYCKFSAFPFGYLTL